MTEAISQELKAHNDRRRYADTLKIYNLRNRTSGEEHDANLHYQAILAQLMLGKPTASTAYMLEQCANYTQEMRGDLKRDTALQLIRQGGDLNRAQSLIQQALEHHKDLPQHAAVDNQALGRLAEARGDDTGAYTLLNGAVNQLKAQGDAVDIGWLSNTAFHLLRVSIKLGYRSRARKALAEVLAHDPSWKKRWAGRAMYHLPAKLGVSLVAHLH